MNAGSRKWLLSLVLCLTWLLFCGFTDLETEMTAGIGSVMDQLTSAEIKEFTILEEWGGRVLANIDDYVNVRAEASEDSQAVGRLFKGDGGYILESADGWTKIKSGNVEGYVKNDYLLFGVEAYERAQEELTLVATANTSGLRIRNEASTEAKILKNVEVGTKLMVVEEPEPEEEPEEAAEEAEEDGGGQEADAEEAPAAGTETEAGEDAEDGAAAEEAVPEEGLNKLGMEAGITAQLAPIAPISGEEEEPTLEDAVSEATKDGWVCVQYAEEKTGYVSAEYVTVQYELGEGMTMAEIKKKEEEEKREKLKQQLAAFKANGNETVLLAALIQAEAGNQPYEGKVGVGAVIMNRVKSPRYPGSIAEVIYAPGQFGPASNGTLARYLGGPSASCMQAAQEAINGYTTVGTFTHFRRAGADMGPNSIVIGSHVFY